MTKTEFVEAVIALCKQAGYSISHEDSQGAFEIVEYDEYTADWLRASVKHQGEL
jgi:hypothetical protein